MCGRYVTPDQAAIERAWDLRGGSSARAMRELAAKAFSNADASPTQRVPLLRIIRDSNGQKELIDARWGLIPHWSNGEPPRSRDGRPLTTFNAKMENLRTSPTYRGAWSRGQRCLVPVRGFYEWQAQPEDWQRTVRHYITVNDQEMFCFAGLWDESKKADFIVIESVTVITMPANELMRTIHNSKVVKGKRTLLPEEERRMPAILRLEDHDIWLSGTPEEAWNVLQQYPSGLMVARPVNGPIDPENDLFHQ